MSSRHSKFVTLKTIVFALYFYRNFKHTKMENNNKIILFQEKEIRRAWHDEEWYYSVIDIIQVLTDSSQPNRYWSDMKKRSIKESNQPFAFCE